MSRIERNELLASLPESYRIRGGEVLRRFVFLIDEALRSAEGRLDGEFSAEDRALGTPNQGSGSARDLAWRFESRGLPVPRLWPGVVAQSEDGLVVFRRTLSRVVTLAWTESEYQGKGDAIVSVLRLSEEWAPVGTSLFAVVLPELRQDLGLISGRSAIGQLVFPE